MNDLIEKFKEKNILVIGDLILDQYIRGSVSRISQEAPVPVVLQDGDGSYTAGGAANVAGNLIALGASVTLVGQVGADQEGKILKSDLTKKEINTKGIIVNSNIPTALKTRFIAQHQQILRVDRERVNFAKKDSIENKLLTFIILNLKNHDAVIISDYGKGVVTSTLVSKVCKLARQANKIITVDPKEDHFDYYSQVTAITPNKKEALNAVTKLALKNSSFKMSLDKLDSESDYAKVGTKLLNYLKLDSLLLTLGEEGMRVFEKGNTKPHIIKTRAQEVFDVTGAGDTVIAVYTLALTAGASIHDAAILSNIAAGIVVGKMGAAAIKKQELISSIKD